MLLSLRQNGLTSLFKEVRVFKVYCPNPCRSRFSGVCLVYEVFQGIWHSNKENPSASWNAALSCPLMPSKLCKLVSRSDLVLELTIPWTFWLVVSYLVYKRASRFIEFETQVAHFCNCLPCSHQNAVAHVATFNLKY